MRRKITQKKELLPTNDDDEDDNKNYESSKKKHLQRQQKNWKPTMSDEKYEIVLLEWSSCIWWREKSLKMLLGSHQRT